MRHATDLGTNRTGIGMAPSLSKKMVEGAQGVPSSQGNEQELARVRRSYSAESAPVGSVPPPSSLKGVAQAGLEMISGRKPSVFLDKLGDRLAFERTGSRLYEAVLAKFDSLGTWEGGPSRNELEEYYNEELRHFEMVREAIESLGGDPTAVTPSADVSGVATEGVIKVATDPRSSLVECLHALHVAELTDNDEWKMLIKLAESLGQNELAGRFRTASQEEDKHLEAVRRWLSVEMELDAKREIEEKSPGQS